MGLAASQARFLQLTARKSNIEYQGQQLNQARTALADQSAKLFNNLLGLNVPVAPTSQDSEFQKPTYSFRVNNDPNQTKTVIDWSPSKDDDGNVVTGRYDFSLQYRNDTGTLVTDSYTYIPLTLDNNGKLTNLKMLPTGSTSHDGHSIDPDDPSTYSEYKNDGTSTQLYYGTQFDQIAYDKAMNDYNYKKDEYDKELASINARTANLQQQDKALELQLRQVDTQQRAVQTEMESVQKVLDKNIELTFKTFA